MWSHICQPWARAMLDLRRSPVQDLSVTVRATLTGGVKCVRDHAHLTG